MNLVYPFRISSLRRSAISDWDEHVQQLIEQVLFTTPGERVNRPDFGSNALQQIFSINSDEIATANQFLLQASLQQWLSDVIQIEDLKVQTQEATLQITIQYKVLKTQERRTGNFNYAI